MDTQTLSSVFDYISFFILYVYSFVYLFKEKTQVLGFGFLIFVQFAFMLYMYVVIIKSTKFYKIPLFFLGYLSLGSILIGSVSYFSLNAVLLLGVVLLFSFINKDIDIREIRNPETIVLLFFMFIALAVLGMSGYQVFLADELLKYSRRQIIHQENDSLS